MTDQGEQQLNLLVGFDAMRAFLNAAWKNNGKKSDGLANLLSNISRDVWANGQPLDIAQWSDWLDAVLAVQPDLEDVREARRQMLDEHQKFARILKMEESEQRVELAKYRTETAAKPWHRGGSCTISTLSAFEAMCSFLSAYWNRDGRRSDDIGGILSGLDRRNIEPQATQWSAWLAAIEAAKSQVSQHN
jgi:hypothetical protein